MARPVSLIFHLQNNKKKKLPEVKSEIMCLQKKKKTRRVTTEACSLFGAVQFTVTHRQTKLTDRRESGKKNPKT